MKFAIVNLGCKVNRVESDSFATSLLARGAIEVPEAEADVIVVNTCTVTGEAEKKTRKAVRRALRANEHALVAVTGCAVAIDADTYRAMDARVRTMGKAELVCAIEQDAWGAGSEHGVSLPMGAGFRTRVGVKVQDGCNNACTYCIVHVARGRATSRPAAEIVHKCVQLADAGVREIVLSGINLGSYRDGDRHSTDACDLAELLRVLLAETAHLHAPGEPPCRFRISSIEPRDVHENLIDVLAASEGRVCRHLHLPLQSGSTKVLREMARPYTAERYGALVEHLRTRVPQLSLTTDIIVGFPGETEEDFAHTCDLAQQCGFSKIHVFPYSKRAGTPAAARADQVQPEVKSRRARELRALSDRLRARDCARRMGSVEYALVEERGAAMIESYYEIEAPASAAVGTLVPVVLEPSLFHEEGLV